MLAGLRGGLKSQAEDSMQDVAKAFHGLMEDLQGLAKVVVGQLQIMTGAD